MAVYPNLPISYGPVFPVEQDKEPRLNISSYGDGYEQASGDGINILRPSTDVAWEGLTKTERDTLDTFLTGRGGALPFMWRYPGDTVDTKWVCRKWKPRFIGPGNYGLSGTFLRSFTP